ncbi:chromosome segregation protein SMC [Candidatus Avelusimicrobium gallicola]|uniref:Chromosome partition protein Smc n=1 Tax=Candidatus Avelusimicrobium gallicola TaxID=2562704 RepID=A0A1Y4DFW2_9BACT|nr:chromosome segregation protein SMC [Elusimicrobium sp. An273]OUO57562.1 chromosome segregation protein SMC [Elusimicrobium sp. An273]
MYLKAIEIIGFKSFADKSRLDFEPGITCVVGPNGCGKSNVIDSVRWAIGEMSWKSLRSSSMVDIIFNGTAKRAPLNMAQVSMVFDNASRQLPLDFNEITVTRKIFRSGESEYYLNKVQCRLRDIRDLFLDTGIGGEGYAIIDQGGVESVLSASPEQRREMFEEVAGVSKYKAKREECIKRLERVDLDLARLSDTVALIEEQIKKLDSEARKARLYQRYREELKESEIAISVCSIKEADGLIAKHTGELEPVLRKLEDLEARISAQEGAAAALDLNLTHKQKEAAEFNEKISASKYQVGLLEGAITNCGNLTAELTAQIAASGAEAQRGQSRLQELAPAIAKLKEQLAAVSAELAPLQEQYNKQVASSQQLETDLRNTEAQSQRISGDLMALVRKQMEVSNRISLEESSAQRENEDLITAEKTSQEQTARAEQITRTLEEISARAAAKQAEADQARGAISAGEEDLRKLQTQRAALNEKLSAVKAARAALAAKLEMIQTQGKNDPYWVGAKAVAQSGLPGVKGTLRKALKYPASLAVAVEEAFGKYLDAVLCQDDNALQQALSVLKQHGKARAKFIVLSHVPQTAAAETGTLKKQLSYASELEDLINFIIGGYSYESGTVTGGFFVSGGAADVRAPEAYWGEEETVRGEMEAKAAEEDAVSKEIISNYDALTRADETLKNLRAKSQEAVVALNVVQNERANKEQELRSVQDALQRAAQRKQEITLRVEGRKKNAETLKQNLEELKNSQAQLTKQGEELKAKQAQLREQSEKIKSEIGTLNARLYEVKIKKNNVELDLKSTEYEFNSLTENEGKRNEKIASSNLRLKSLAEEKLSTQAKLSAERDTLAKLEVDEHKMRADLEALKKEYSDKTAALNACKKESSELAIKKNDLENALANARRQRTTVTNNLFESWNITPEEAQMNYGDKTVDYERVKMMRKRIENMGAVNMTAPEEYDALTERNTFLRTQMADLDGAKKDLKSAINKINQTTRENFKYTFEQVRTHFKNIYQTLFRGGECDLVLTQPENLLETGIEIYAQPPGKKLLNISSMSGGEKTLTAMSLLFAFFTHNPSPFCIMDEADAALDEANVERYVNLIKEFSKTTQFIVVTHNKRTMEAARMLYGITMEESGVSKVLSVNLADRSNPEDIKKKEAIEALAEA